MFSDWNGKAALAALTTPFTAQGRVDRLKYSAHAVQLLKRGLHGVVPFGTTGEGASLGFQEKAESLETLIAQGIPPRNIVMGIAASSADEAVQAAGHALGLGCRGILLAPPFYFKAPPEEGLYRWFSEVISRLGARARGVVLYHIPQVTGVALSVDLVNRLHAAFGPVVAAIKDSYGDIDTTRRYIQDTGLPTLVGHEGLLSGLIGEGAVGSISGLANLVPERIVQVVNHSQSDALFEPMVRLVVSYPVVPAVKTLLAHQTREPAWLLCRSPLEALGRESSAQLLHSWEALRKAHAA
ncbi:MAG: dihydrodipicolinate synthase family protein [Deltaproteobacteria bacterium]|nr:dihydrodipicolinate synthase family protein [Deltaproteobacteria bacterium]